MELNCYNLPSIDFLACMRNEILEEVRDIRRNVALHMVEDRDAMTEVQKKLSDLESHVMG